MPRDLRAVGRAPRGSPCSWWWRLGEPAALRTGGRVMGAQFARRAARIRPVIDLLRRELGLTRALEPP